MLDLASLHVGNRWNRNGRIIVHLHRSKLHFWREMNPLPRFFFRLLLQQQWSLKACKIACLLVEILICLCYTFCGQDLLLSEDLDQVNPWLLPSHILECSALIDDALVISGENCQQSVNNQFTGAWTHYMGTIWYTDRRYGGTLPKDIDRISSLFH